MLSSHNHQFLKSIGIMRSVQFVSSTVEVQGHRGASYIYPENTIESFIAAAESGSYSKL
jgi:glycerophosphoryl diester phosphodiesterase